VFTSKQIAVGIVAAAGLTAGAGAHAFTSQQGPQRHELRALGLGVMSVTPAMHEARVIVQCGDGRGELVTVKLRRGVDLAQLTPGATVGAVVLTPDNLVVRLAPPPPTCRRDTLEGAAASGTDTLPAGAPMASETLPAETSAAGAASRASHSPSTTATRLGTSAQTSRSQRTWTFLGKAKRDDLGVLSLDVDRVNLPASYVTQRYLFTDHHARMVVGRATAISDVTGRRISALQLDDATVRVQAAIAAPSTWRSDDEGRRVPTIIAKRIVVLEFDQ
jgi:hypothetical protein